MTRDKTLVLLITIVLTHFAITLAHGAAHATANVNLGPAGLAFVLIVIEIAPLAGLASMRVNPRGGAWRVAATLAAALLFGLVNHFIIPGADRGGYVGAHALT